MRASLTTMPHSIAVAVENKDINLQVALHAQYNYPKWRVFALTSTKQDTNETNKIAHQLQTHHCVCILLTNVLLAATRLEVPIAIPALVVPARLHCVVLKSRRQSYYLHITITCDPCVATLCYCCCDACYRHPRNWFGLDSINCIQLLAVLMPVILPAYVSLSQHTDNI